MVGLVFQSPEGMRWMAKRGREAGCPLPAEETAAETAAEGAAEAVLLEAGPEAWVAGTLVVLVEVAVEVAVEVVVVVVWGGATGEAVRVVVTEEEALVVALEEEAVDSSLGPLLPSPYPNPSPCAAPSSIVHSFELSSRAGSEEG